MRSLILQLHFGEVFLQEFVNEAIATADALEKHSLCGGVSAGLSSEMIGSDC